MPTPTVTARMTAPKSVATSARRSDSDGDGTAERCSSRRLGGHRRRRRGQPERSRQRQPLRAECEQRGLPGAGQRRRRPDQWPGRCARHGPQQFRHRWRRHQRRRRSRRQRQYADRYRWRRHAERARVFGHGQRWRRRHQPERLRQCNPCVPNAEQRGLPCGGQRRRRPDQRRRKTRSARTATIPTPMATASAMAWKRAAIRGPDRHRWRRHSRRASRPTDGDGATRCRTATTTASPTATKWARIRCIPSTPMVTARLTTWIATAMATASPDALEVGADAAQPARQRQ